MLKGPEFDLAGVADQLGAELWLATIMSTIAIWLAFLAVGAIVVQYATRQLTHFSGKLAPFLRTIIVSVVATIGLMQTPLNDVWNSEYNLNVLAIIMIAALSALIYFVSFEVVGWIVSRARRL